MSRRAAIAALGALAWLSGCTSSHAIDVWQRSVETYIDEHANGDPTVLRSVATDPVTKDFGLLAAEQGGIPFVLPSRTDVRSVILGHRVFDDRSWFIFAVGVIRYCGAMTDFPLDDTQLLDVRAAALSADGGEYEWRLATRDMEMLDVYIEPQVEKWRRSDPARESASRPWTTFPTPGDDWTVEPAPDGVRVTDEHSGATWSLKLHAGGSR